MRSCTTPRPSSLNFSRGGCRTPDYAATMSGLSYDRHRAELATQTCLLRSCVEGADMTVPVPTCPGWTLGQLLRHVGGTHHWAESVVRTRATGPVPEDLVNDVSAYADADPEAMDAWVAEGAAGLADALRAAGPAARVWTPGPGGTTAFWARRMLFEAVVHRADASWAVGAEFTVDDDVAVDGIDEWMGFGTVPEVIEPRPGVPRCSAPAAPCTSADRARHRAGWSTSRGTRSSATARTAPPPGPRRSRSAPPCPTCSFSCTPAAPRSRPPSRSPATHACWTSGWSARGSGSGSEVRPARARPRCAHEWRRRADRRTPGPAPTHRPSARRRPPDRRPRRPRPARHARTPTGRSPTRRGVSRRHRSG